MEFKKGDKVAFLNEPLKGIVIDCINDTHLLIDCEGMEMDVAKQELIRINYIPKIEGKNLFPIKKEDKKIDEIPNLYKKVEDYKQLSVGDQVVFMSDNTKGKILSILSHQEYEVEIHDGFTIPVNRIEIEKIILTNMTLDQKGVSSQIRKDLKKEVSKESKSNQSTPNFFNHNELDLHIENLIDSWQGLSNFEIVTLQLQHFRKRLYQALEDNEPSLVVIHGIGKGILKEEIYKYLLQFPNITVGPADAKLYGMGASEIKIG
tara:strand:+ start:807 stop:1592 length:786 start_codon:yes stop_codon:yes gene_type:complete